MPAPAFMPTARTPPCCSTAPPSPRNGTGISAVNGGQLISYGNNKVNNSLGPDGTPTGNYSPL